MLARTLILMVLSAALGGAWAVEEAGGSTGTENGKDRAKYKAFSENMLGFRGVAEVWQDSAIAQVHRSSRFAGTGFYAAGLTGLFGIEIELGYSRMTNPAVDKETGQQTTDDTSFEMMPVAIDATIRIETGRSEVFFGMGPAMVAFNDRSPTNAISGTKLGFDFRLGTRIRTWFIQESIRPDPRGINRMDFEILLGRRQHHMLGVGKGLNLSAWRVGAGIVARL